MVDVNILAIDIGTTTGWAMRTRDGVIRSSSHACAIKGLEGRGQRWLKFRALLNEIDPDGLVNVVYFEQVISHGNNSSHSAHIFGGFLAMLEVWCEMRNIRLIGVGVGVVKKNWTGNGAAKKPEMIAQAVARGFSPKDDNEADALAILSLALVREKQARIEPPVAALFDEVAA